MQHGGGGQLGGGPVFALGQGKAHRLGHAQALAVLGQALHIQDLLKGDGRLLALQGGAVPAFPGAEGLICPLTTALPASSLTSVTAALPLMSSTAAGGWAKATVPSAANSLSSTAARRTPAARPAAAGCRSRSGR